MGGQNPYIADPDIKLPTRKFKVTFLPMDVTVEVDPSELPYGDDGLAGSILDIALHHGVEIDHACGGVCGCATCHVHVRQGLDSCSEATDEEEDRLDEAADLSPSSRLSCQTVPDGTGDLVIYVPEWNRNLAREEPH